MHIEPGVVDGAKMALSYATAAASFGGASKLAWDHIAEHGIASFAAKTLLSSAAVFTFFQVFFHYPVGVSEVHLILGSSLLLILGAAPAAWGLAIGLLIQGLLFAPFDLPQYGINVTTLLMPLFAIAYASQKIVRKDQAYVDLNYSQVLRLSCIYQGGTVSWVAFWAFYGQGFGAENLANVAKFGAAYMTVILVEPLIDLGLLSLAKTARAAGTHPLARAVFNDRLFSSQNLSV